MSTSTQISFYDAYCYASTRMPDIRMGRTSEVDRVFNQAVKDAYDLPLDALQAEVGEMKDLIGSYDLVGKLDGFGDTMEASIPQAYTDEEIRAKVFFLVFELKKPT